MMVNFLDARSSREWLISRERVSFSKDKQLWVGQGFGSM